jgi:hypothetical protein
MCSFFFQLCFIRFFNYLFIYFCIPKSFGPWSKLHPPFFFPSCVGTLTWNKPYIGGPSKAFGSSDIFKRKGLISPVLWKMLLRSVVKRHMSSKWKNGTWPWTISKSSRRIVSWFMKGLWLLSCYTRLFRPIKPPSISTPWPTCGSLADVWLGLVPLRLGWPCLDTDFATMIVSLPG